MEAGKRTIRDIFNGMRILEIPYFQRSYVWDEDNWDRFLEDLQVVAKTHRPYFLGSVILKQKPTGAGASTGDVRIVIDGQQRLTTLFLFLKVLGHVRNQENLTRQTFYNLANCLALNHNHLDSPVFEAIISDALTPQLEANYAQNKVLSAYRYFEARAETISLIDPMQVLGNLYFVGIDLGAEEDEQQVFNTINSLGVSLSTAELLKNDLFSRENAALYDATWLKVFENSEDTRQYWSTPITAGRERRENIDLFMQAFLLMIVDDPENVRVDALYPSYKAYLSTIKDRRQFIEDLTEGAAIYGKYIDPTVQDRQVAKTDLVDRLAVIVFGLSTTTVVPYILYVLRNAPSSEQDRIFSRLEGYLMRRLICKGSSKNYNRFFGALIKDQVRTADELVSRFAKEANTVNRYPTDADVEAGVKSTDLTNKQALVFLWLLELSIRNERKQSTALSGLSHYSLEHLMPKKWRNHWGALTVERGVQRDIALRKLGNLSILASGLNTSISDSDWATKKEGSGNHKGLLEYARGLETLSEDLTLASWDEGRIEARAERLGAKVNSSWPSPL